MSDAPENRASDPLTLRAWPAIIRSVTSVFGFLTLLVLSFASVLFFLSFKQPSFGIYYLVAYVMVLLALVLTVTLIAFRRPFILGIAGPYGDRFPEVLGTYFYDALHPYLSNLEPSDLDEALAYWRQRLSPTGMKLTVAAERDFVAIFSAAILDRAERILKPLAQPPPR